MFSARGKSWRPFAFWSVLAILFVSAAWRRFSLPLDPITDPDIWGYLSPALLKLTGGDFVHLEGRNFVYPAFVLMVLRVFGDFRTITIVQHLLGMAAGAVAIVTWRRVAIFVPKPSLPPIVHEVLGFFFAGVVLLAGEPIRTEMQLRPEGVCAFVLSLNLYFVIEFIRRAFLEKRSAVIFGAGIGVTALLLASLKPSFILLTALAAVPVAIFFFRATALREKCLLGLALLLSALGILVPEYLLSGSDEAARTFLPTTLFTTHANLIRDQLADDLDYGAATPYEPARLRRILEQLKPEIEKSAVAEGWRFPSLGFSPDYLMHNPGLGAAEVAVEFNDDMTAVSAFYYYYYWRCWQQRPLPMTTKVARQLALFYALACSAYDRGKNIPLAAWYEQSVGSLDRSSQPAVWNKYPPAAELLQRSRAIVDLAPVIEQNRLIRKALAFLALAYLPLLVATLAFAIAVLLQRRLRSQFSWLAVLTLFVFSYNAAVSLETATVHSLEVPRYATIQFYFTVLAECLAIRLLLEAVASAIRWGRPIQTSAPGE
jgi:hypothetical protein